MVVKPTVGGSIVRAVKTQIPITILYWGVSRRVLSEARICDFDIKYSLTVAQDMVMIIAIAPHPDKKPTNLQNCRKRIALLHYDVTIKIFIKVLLFNATDHGNLWGGDKTKQIQ